MQYDIRKRRQEYGPGLEVGFWFDNSHKEFLSPEYVMKLIVDYCIEQLKKTTNNREAKRMAISVGAFAAGEE